jgi:hypothetical protein
MATDQEILDHDYSNLSLFISTPMYGGQCTALFHQSLMGLQRLCLQVGLKAAISDQWQESLITRARNYEVDKFRASGMTHHLFIDADQGFSPGDIFQLILADKDIATAPVAKKHINWEQVAAAAKVGFPPNILDEFAAELNINTIEPVKMDGAPQRVREGGTGIFLVKRHVYDKIQASYPEIQYVPMVDEPALFEEGKFLYAFFDTAIDPETRHYLSEDWTFCRRWTRIGGEVYVLPWLKTAHVGQYVYIANAPALAALQEELRKKETPRIVIPNEEDVRRIAGTVIKGAVA